MTTLKYKDYVGSAELDVDRAVLRGKILFISDLVTYEADSVKGLNKEFQEAVDDYVATCQEIGKEPQKSFTGTFNIRLEPECHKALAILAATDGRTLNAVMAEAAHWYINERNGGTRKVEHLHTVVVEVDSKMSAVVGTSTSPAQWRMVDVCH